MLRLSFLKKYTVPLLSLAGFACLLFTLGIAAERYEFVPRIVNDGFEAGKALYEQFQDLYAEANDDSTANIGNGRVDPDNAAQVEYGVKHSKVQWDEKLTEKGYTLLTFHYSTTAYLVGMKGKVIHSWSMPFRNAFPHPTHVKNPVPENWIQFPKAEVFPNGDLLAVYEGWGDTPYGYGLVKMDKDSNVLWTYSGNVHHDFYIDKKNGNIYAIIHNFVTRPIPGLEKLSYPTLADSIVILSPDGKELDRIPILEAFRDSAYAQTLYQRPRNIIGWDRVHANSVMKLEPDIADKFPMFHAGQILISARNLNTIAVLDPTTRKIVWAHTGIWHGQHSASFLNNGHILLFDNKGSAVKNKIYSRLLEFRPDTLEVTWSYLGSPEQPFYSEAYGRTSRLNNGNTLVTEAMSWRVFEVTPEGKIAWNYQLPRLFNQPPEPHKPKDQCISPIFDDIAEDNFYMAALPISATRYQQQDLPFLLPNASSFLPVGVRKP